MDAAECLSVDICIVAQSLVVEMETGVEAQVLRRHICGEDPFLSFIQPYSEWGNVVCSNIHH